MKKNVKVLVGLMALVLSFAVGGVAYAYSGGYFDLYIGNMHYHGSYDGTDKATLEVYSGDCVSNGYDTNPSTNKYYEEYTRPEFFVKTIKDYDGNEVDYSVLEVTYELAKWNGETKKYEFEGISKEEIVDEDGDINLTSVEEDLRINYTYRYSVPNNSFESSITKSVIVELGIF